MLTRLTDLKTAPTVAAGLIAGFGVAEVTDVRALGGVVLAAAGIAAGNTWLRRDGAATTVALSAVYLGGFVGSHLLAKEIGAWPSVFAVSAVSAAASYALSDRKVQSRAK
ncbi:MAG: hypothetical protein ACTHOG_04505 [Marmoricola sp.]